MENQEIQLMECMLNQLKESEILIWQHGIVVMPILSFDDFDWWYEEDTFYRYLILNSGENTIRINTEDILTIEADELLNELVIFMKQDLLLQIWGDIN